MAKNNTYIDPMGGQAVMGGVMMRSISHYAISVRKPDGTIETRTEKVKSIADKYTWLKTPFIRGMVYLIEMLIIGIKALTWSANKSADEEDEELSNTEIFITITISLGFAILLFIVLPFFVTTLFVNTGFWFNIIDGVIRIAVLVGYMAIISLMSDVKELFRYHGAEHKTVYCYEAGKPLTVKNIKPYTTKHPRCGTSFIIIVLLLSIFVYSLVGGSLLIKLLSRIVLLPVIAGISFEALKYSAKHLKNPLVYALVQPGLWLQGITTKEPTPKQIEVAIAALKAAKNDTDASKKSKKSKKK